MKQKILFITIIIISISFLSFCTNDDSPNNGDGTNDAQNYSIGGIVTGLLGSGLVLQNNDKDDLEIISN